MFNFIMILVFGTMVHDLCAMQQKEPKPKGRKISLSLPSLPTVTINNKPLPSPNDSPKGSPTNLSTNASPNDSPRISPKDTKNFSKDNIKFSPKKNSKNDLMVDHQVFLETNLWKAIENNDTEKALVFIQPNMDIAHPVTGKTALIKAIKKQNEVIVKALLNHENIDVNLADKCRNTPLHHAVLACNEAIIKLLLHDYRVNSLLTGNGNKIPQQLTDNEFYSDKDELKKMFESRAILDVIVNDKASSLQCLQSDDKDSLDNMIAVVKNIYYLPSYANDEFLKNMILYRIAEYIKIKNKV